MIQVEVAYARPDRQEIVPVNVPEGTTALEAAKLSGISDIFPEIDPDTIDMGVFGKVIRTRPPTNCVKVTGWNCIAR